MTKKKISEKQNTSSKNIRADRRIDESKFEVHKPLEYLLNEDNILGAIAECLDEKDLQGIVEIVKIYNKTLRRSKLLRQDTVTQLPILNYQNQLPGVMHEAPRQAAKLALKKSS